MTLHPTHHQHTPPDRHALPSSSQPSSSQRRPHPGRRRAGAAILSAVALALVSAGPALAHDQLLSASPAAGTAVLETPSELSLTFSGNLIAGEGISNVATVTDANGHQWQDGQAETSGPELSAALCEGMPNGEYAVSYRVVYSDGHSEEKSYDFTLEDPGAPEDGVPQDCGVVNPDAPVSSEASTPAAQDGSTGAATAEATAEATAQPAEDTTTVPGWVWPVAIGGLIVVVLAMLLVFRRARNIATSSDTNSGTDRN